MVRGGRPRAFFLLGALHDRWDCVSFGKRCSHSRRLPMANPFEFIQAVRSETGKITWPTRRDTLITTALVFVMVVVASLFFLATDAVIQVLVRVILGLGH